MTLSDWLTKHDMSGAEFARRIKVDAALVNYWRNGVQPRAAMLYKIEQATDGAVRAVDFVNGKRKRRA